MTKRYPFKFLDAYNQSDTDIFFGRDEEVEALYQMTFQSDILLVYGASGTGKTSLINCGLASRFQAHDWLALNIRRGNDINAALQQKLDEAAVGTTVGTTDLDLSWLDEDEADDEAESTLSRQLTAIYRQYFRPVYLIFDQFEELYVLGSKAEQAQFIRNVQEIESVDQPVKMIFVIREEYLGHLFEFERAVPQLLRKKLRVEPMNLDKVGQVVRGAAALDRSNVRLEAGQEAAIVEGIFSKIRGSEQTLSIQLPYLQVFLDKLYLQVTGDEARQADAVFTARALAEMGDIGDVLRDFLEEQAVRIQKQLSDQYPKLPEDAVWQLLSPLATLEGTKEPMLEETLLQRLAHLPPAAVRDGLHALDHSRILRYDEQEGRYEVAHDSLAARIAEHRNDDEIALLEIRRLITSQLALKAEARALFTEKQLNLIDPYLDKLALEPEALKLIKDSRKEVAATARRKRRRNMVIGSVLAAAAVVSIFFAFQAKAQTRVALEKSEEALNATLRAEENLKQAKAAEIKANTALAQVEKEQAATEEQRLIAIKNLENAERQRQRAEDNLNSLNATSKQVVGVLIEQARELIFECKYEEALVKLLDGAKLVDNYPPLGRALMELAFFYGEAGDAKQATSLAATVARLLDKPASGINVLPTVGTFDHLALERYRKALRPLDSQLYDSFNQRYYPVMIDIQGGTFTMGRHPVTLSSFQLAQTETTVWQYSLYCTATGQDSIQSKRRSTWSLDGNTPVIKVSWYDAERYANWVSRQMGKDTAYNFVLQPEENTWEVELNPNAKETFRLPTEAEWEYTARGGVQQDTFIYSGSNEIDTVAWYSRNADRTMPVARKKANGLGLYDMSGNVWEWCQDWYSSYKEEEQINPIGPDSGSNRVLRGGSWRNDPINARCADRRSNTPDNRSLNIGFRLARTGGQ